MPRGQDGLLCGMCASGLGLTEICPVNGAVDARCSNCGRYDSCLPRCDFAEHGVPKPLRLTNDRKTRAYPSQDNTLGLPAGPVELGGSCPWCTRGKGGCFHIPEGRKAPTCYAWNIMRAYKGSGNVLRSNMESVLEAGKRGRESLVSLLCRAVSGFRDRTLEHARSKGVDPGPLMKFRIHWSGDMFSDEYAMAWAETCLRFPDVSFWTYTRSYRTAMFLRGIPNLKLYLSLDGDSWERGMCEFFRLGGASDPMLGVAFMARSEDFVAGCLADMAWRPSRYGDPDEVSGFCGTALSRCPVDLGKMELTGACCKCRMCIAKGSQLLWFKC